MGISLSINVAKSVTQEEWQSVYEETLCLAEKFELADIGTFKWKEGIEAICLVRTKEREIDYWDDIELGWGAVSDYNSLEDSDWYGLKRNLVKPEEFNPEALDPMAVYILHEPWPYISDSNYENPYNSYSMWGGKISGSETYEALFAIAFLIEDRLREKAFVYEDVDIRFCKEAIERANQYLEKPIQMPIRCDANRLAKRIHKLPIDMNQKISGFINLYLREEGREFGAILREHFSEESLNDYWRAVFNPDNNFNGSIKDQLENYERWYSSFFNLENLLDLKNADVKRQYESFMIDYCKKVYSAISSFNEKDRQIIAAAFKEFEAAPRYQYNFYKLPYLLEYKNGESIDPNIFTKIKKIFWEYLDLNHSKQFERYMRFSAVSKCKYLAKHANYLLLLRDIDWEKIFTDIEKNPESFRRYFPMTRLTSSTYESRSIIRAIVLNDDFYEMLLEEMVNAK
jgi:hypothetical protein